MSKKILIIIITIFVVLIVALFTIAFFISRDTDQTTVQTFEDFLPFGGGGEDATFREPLSPTPRDGGEFAIEGESGEKVILLQLTTTSIAGMFSFNTDADTTLVRYVDRAVGHIYEINLKDGSRARLTNTTIPGVREALWGEGGRNIILRYLDENEKIKSFAGKIVSSGEEGKLEGVYLEDNITEMVVSPDKKRIFYLTQIGTTAIGTTANFDGSKKKQIFEFPFSEWAVSWPREEIITFTTMPSAHLDGFLYFFNTKTRILDKIFGNIAGLTTNTSPDNAYVFFSKSFTRGIGAQTYNVKNETFLDFPLKTLPEKCVWSKNETTRLYCAAPSYIPKGDFPDDWYQGVVSFKDNMWSIDIETGAVTILASPQNIAREEIDIIHPILSEGERYLFFINKKDSTLWTLKLAD